MTTIMLKLNARNRVNAVVIYMKLNPKMEDRRKVSSYMIKRIILHWTAGRYYPTQFENNITII